MRRTTGLIAAALTGLAKLSGSQMPAYAQAWASRNIIRDAGVKGE